MSDSPCSCRLCCGLCHTLWWSLFVVACCLSNGRLHQQWVCISVGTGCLGNGWLHQQWACISVGAGCLRSGGCPSPTERLRPSAWDSLKSRFCSSHWVPQMICPCNPLGWPTVQVSFSLKSSSLKSQVAGSAGHPDKRALWGLLGRAGCRRPGCRLHQADLLPGVPCLFYTWEFPRSLGNKDQSGNAAPTHLFADSMRAPILGCSHSTILSPQKITFLWKCKNIRLTFFKEKQAERLANQMLRSVTKLTD